MTGWLLAAALLSPTSDLAVAESALRDGLWDVARRHAAVVVSTNDEARLVTLESFAREERWKDLLSAYDSMGYPVGEGFAYCRALALFKEGSLASASNVIASVTNASDRYRMPVRKLRAEIARAMGDVGGALKILGEGGDVDSKLLTASLMVARGDRRGADGLWREVLANTNAGEAARAVAASGLGDERELRILSTNAVAKHVRLAAACGLGVRLLSGEETFDEGVALITGVVRDKPDLAGACEAYHAIADARLSRREFAAAGDSYRNMMRTWPATAGDAMTHIGLGWALSGAGKKDEALAEFVLAEKSLGNAETRAHAAAKAADTMCELGRDDEAMKAYRAVVAKYPDTAVAERVRERIRLRKMEDEGRESYRAFNFRAAREKFGALAKDDPSQAVRMDFYRALCLYGDGLDDDAEQEMRRIADGSGDASVRIRAQLWLAKFEYNSRRWKDSCQRFLSYAGSAGSAADVSSAYLWAARAAMHDNDMAKAISIATDMVKRFPKGTESASAMLLQAEALFALARFDEVVMILERAKSVPDISAADRERATMLNADALFALGADNSARYDMALKAYQDIRSSGKLSPDSVILVEFKIARTLERLKRTDEAVDCYYSNVVLAYRSGVDSGERYAEPARAAFVRAAFWLADRFESVGMVIQAVNMLELVRTSGLSASEEASNRIGRLKGKGVF